MWQSKRGNRVCDAVGGWGGGAPERGPLGQSVAKPRPLGLPHTPAVACGGGPGVTWGPTAVGARAPQLPPNHCHPAQLGSLGRWVLSQIGGGAVLAAPRGLCTSWAREQDPPISYDGRQSCPSGAHGDGKRWVGAAARPPVDARSMAPRTFMCQGGSEELAGWRAHYEGSRRDLNGYR